MKKILPLVVLVCFIVGCKERALEDNFIYFAEAQPVNVDAISEFPDKYIGSYSENLEDQLVIEKKCIYVSTKITETHSLSELDTMSDYRLDNQKIIDLKKNKVYKATIQNDTITWEFPVLDTIFSFRKDEVAKIYKSAIILNTKEENKYATSIIHCNKSGAVWQQLGSRNDFSILHSNYNIPFTVVKKEQDTSHVILHPSRADFRKLLRAKGFEFDNFF